VPRTRKHGRTPLRRQNQDTDSASQAAKGAEDPVPRAFFAFSVGVPRVKMGAKRLTVLMDNCKNAYHHAVYVVKMGGKCT